MDKKLALIGFGEAGSTFAEGARWRDSAWAFDISPHKKTDMDAAGVIACDTAKEAVRDAPFVLSLVTADQALAAATACARLLNSGTIWCDMNSVAPATKCKAAGIIESAGGRYVDVAVLAPVNLARMAVPLLVSGSAAVDAESLLNQAGFTNVRVVGTEVGQASAIKMIRSIMVKGIEALSAELMLAAQAAGVSEEVLASLDASERSISWAQRATYNLERMKTHGARRAAEMEEVAKTLAALGVEPVMTRGTIQRQREMCGKASEEEKA